MLKQRLVSPLEKIARIVNAARGRVVCQLAQTGAGIVRKPEHEPVERLFEYVVVIQEPLELLVFDAVWRMAAGRAVAEKHRDRRLAIGWLEEVKVALGQIEFEAVDREPSVPDSPGRFERTGRQHLTERWWSQRSHLVFVPRGRHHRRERRESDEHTDKTTVLP